MLFDYKHQHCAHCGLHEPDDLCVYDLHHIDPTQKEYKVSSLLTWSWERIKEEADKCRYLCANCHRKEHARLHKEAEDYED